MKNIRIIESCQVSGKHVEAGTVIKNIDTRLAADLVGSGRAVDVTRLAKDEPAIEHRDPVGKNRDPKPAKKAGKGKDEPAIESAE